MFPHMKEVIRMVVCEVGESWAYAVERSNHKDKFGVNEKFGKNNWDREIIVSNGKNIVMWTLNLEDNDCKKQVFNQQF